MFTAAITGTGSTGNKLDSWTFHDVKCKHKGIKKIINYDAAYWKKKKELTLAYCCGIKGKTLHFHKVMTS